MPDARPEIGARLDHVCFHSPAPDRLAAFFARGFDMTATAAGPLARCTGAEREVFVSQGPVNRTAWFAYAFATPAALADYRARVAASGAVIEPAPTARFDDTAFAVRDPDGNVVAFGTRPAGSDAASPGVLPARLQHVVFRSVDPDAMVRFYERSLGFVVSDRVRDAAGVLRACFLRTDAEHHSLAIFRAPESRLDHHSYETTDWEHIRRWADHLAKRDIPIFWGVGRHGPGDDLFFMVKDPDDNLVEISAEIEQCPIDRQEGLWPHAERTLNVWGNAILRS